MPASAAIATKPRVRVKAGRNVIARNDASNSAFSGGSMSGYEGGRFRRRLSSWMPTQNTINTILTSQGPLLRARCRDTLRNNPHANAGCDSYVANLIGAGIKPSSLIADNPDLRASLQELWLDWTDECDADGLTDFYGMQTIIARQLFEAGEVFVRFRPRLLSDGLTVPLQIQLLESEMCPYNWNRMAPNGNWIMNGIELDFRGKRAAYWMFAVHPGDALIEPGFTTQPVRIPASEILHIFKCTRPGQMRGVPLVAPALVKLFFLDQYDDAELERKKIAAMFAGFVTSPTPEDVVPVDDMDGSADQENVGLTGLEPGTLQTLLPGEEIVFSEPADVGGSYELFQYRQQLAVFSAMGVPYSTTTGDLKRANYSTLRGAIIEFRRKLEQVQHNIIVFQFCRAVWQRWLNEAVLAESLSIAVDEYMKNLRAYRRCKWIAPRFEWVDPLKDRQAEKLAVDSGFKSRSDVVEAEGADPEENDKRIAADHKREEQYDLVFPFATAAVNQPLSPSDQDAADEAAQEAADQNASDNADSAAA
jgi:lambda family phage portal protein